MNVKERYAPVPMAADSSIRVSGSNLGGFLCVASGTVTVTDANNVVIVDTLPVTAGVYYPMPFLITYEGSQPGYLVELAGGAAGTLAV
jgi:hypothetical protein